MKKIVIAIDGYSSCGKSTMAKALACKLGYKYIDSGAMYRAATLYAMRNGMISADGSVDAGRLVASLPDIDLDFRTSPEWEKAHIFLNGEDVESAIRTLEVSSHVSPVAAIGELREDLVRRQQAFGQEKGIVMDGRDIGTTVFPDAEMKIFVEASPEVRAHRRWLELKAKGDEVPYEDVYANVVERDEIDMTREVSPLRKAEDAIVLDNGNLTPSEQLAELMRIYDNIVGV